MFDHSSAWKPFLYLKACYLPAVFAGSLRAICNVHNTSQVGREVNKMNRKLLLLVFLVVSDCSPLPFQIFLRQAFGREQ